MEAEFWLNKWKKNEIGFHEGSANALLVRFHSQLRLEKGSRVFLPLCGKTRDIAWLLSQGFRVAGAELSELAIEQLFAELGVRPERSKAGKVMRYSGTDIEILVGDIFDVSYALLGHVDATYDRAALVAMPEQMRGRYASHLMEITNKAPQLLIAFEYEQRLQDGPPFSISSEKLADYYSGTYDLTRLARLDVPGGLKGKCAATESAWLLSPR